mgnify:CR=1 FL=1
MRDDARDALPCGIIGGKASDYIKTYDQAGGLVDLRDAVNPRLDDICLWPHARSGMNLLIRFIPRWARDRNDGPMPVVSQVVA